MGELETEHNENRDSAADLLDPLLTAEDISARSGLSLRRAQEIICESGVGETIRRATKGRPVIGVRWSVICGLRDSYIEHEELFGEK